MSEGEDHFNHFNTIITMSFRKLHKTISSSLRYSRPSSSLYSTQAGSISFSLSDDQQAYQGTRTFFFWLGISIQKGFADPIYLNIPPRSCSSIHSRTHHTCRCWVWSDNGRWKYSNGDPLRYIYPSPWSHVVCHLISNRHTHGQSSKKPTKPVSWTPMSQSIMVVQV